MDINEIIKKYPDKKFIELSEATHKASCIFKNLDDLIQLDDVFMYEISSPEDVVDDISFKLEDDDSAFTIWLKTEHLDDYKEFWNKLSKLGDALYIYSLNYDIGYVYEPNTEEIDKKMQQLKKEFTEYRLVQATKLKNDIINHIKTFKQKWKACEKVKDKDIVINTIQQELKTKFNADPRSNPTYTKAYIKMLLDDEVD